MSEWKAYRFPRTVDFLVFRDSRQWHSAVVSLNIEENGDRKRTREKESKKKKHLITSVASPFLRSGVRYPCESQTIEKQNRIKKIMNVIIVYR